MIENEFAENVSILLYIVCYIHIYFQIRSGSFINNVRVCNSTVLIFLDMYCMLLSIEVYLFRLGMEQDHLKTIVNDILDMDTNNKWEVTTSRFIR